MAASPQLKSLGDRQAPYGRVLSLFFKVAGGDASSVHFSRIRAGSVIFQRGDWELEIQKTLRLNIKNLMSF